MKKLRIAFFAEILIKEFDGATRTMFQIIDRIESTQYEFLFFCGEAPKEDFPHETFHVPAITIPFNKTYKMASMFGNGPSIRKKLKEFSPHIIHIATPSPLGYFGLKYGRSKNIPVISIYHTHFLSYIKYYTKNTPVITPALEQAMVLHNKSFYDQCDLIYMPTDEMVHQLQQRGFETNKMKIWRRGIQLDLFTPRKRKERYFQPIVNNSHPNILFASRLVWEKNLKTLIDFYNLIQERKLDYNLIIVGDGVAKAELELQMPKAVFLGHVNHKVLSTIYASSDYFVFPSDTETYGNVVAEAMASGLPCVVANGGGVKSFIKQGQNGFLCTPNDPSDYLKMIEILEVQPELKENITGQALLDVASLNWDDLVHEYFSDLKKLAESPISNSSSFDLGIIAA